MMHKALILSLSLLAFGCSPQSAHEPAAAQTDSGSAPQAAASAPEASLRAYPRVRSAELDQLRRALDLGEREKALALIAQYRESVKTIRTKENDMKAGLGIFAIDPPVNAETASTEFELDFLDQVWSMMANWTKNMDQWKTGKFASMNVPEIETVAADFGKQITKLAKEFKGGTGGNWKVGEDKL